MNELVNQEKTQLQALFDPFNERGSWMTLAEGREQPLRLGIMEGYLVTRVAPHFDTQGNVTQVDFWLFHKALGYHEGFQHAHTIKVVRWSQEDTYLLDLVDDRGRRFHIELIFPELERDLGADWKRWNEYKAENREMFERIDAELLAEHIKIAENWPS